MRRLTRICVERLGNAWNWRKFTWRQWMLKCLGRMGSAWLIHLRWPFHKPWQHSHLKLYSFGGGLGDELMCTPIFAEIKKRNPSCKLTFISRYPILFANHPHIDVIQPFSKNAIKNAYALEYQHLIPPPRPLIKIMAECVGLDSVQCIPYVVFPKKRSHPFFSKISPPRIVIQPLAGCWTPNKNWPLIYWRQLVELLTKHRSVIEVGNKPAFSNMNFGSNFYSFAGQTDIVSFANLIRQADLFIGPVSSGMHFAAAAHIPSIIIFGGYESPNAYLYVTMTSFFTQVDCAPCWMTTPCPHDLKCLRAIQPEVVYQAVDRILAGGKIQQ